MDISTWAAFVFASFVVLIVPGPTILLVMSYALSHGRKVAFLTASGVALGDLIAMTLSLIGFGALMMASASLFAVVKWVGALYLIYLGISLIINAAHSSEQISQSALQVKPQNVFFHATIVTALNPKSIAFFVAFVPQFIDANQNLTLQFIVLIATFVVLASLNAFTYALFADHLRSRIQNANAFKWLSRLGGTVLILMGILTAFLKRNSA